MQPFPSSRIGVGSEDSTVLIFSDDENDRFGQAFGHRLQRTCTILDLSNANPEPKAAGANEKSDMTPAGRQ